MAHAGGHWKHQRSVDIARAVSFGERRELLGACCKFMVWCIPLHLLEMGIDGNWFSLIDRYSGQLLQIVGHVCF